MSYTPTTWAAGDTVTAAKLNKLEQGVASGGGVLVVTGTLSDNTVTLDKTWQEITDALKAGIVTVYLEEDEDTQGSEVVISCLHGVDYRVVTVSERIYIASSASGYPSYTFE